MNFKDFLSEKTETIERHAVLAFGRMNPITNGHQQLVDTVKRVAEKVKGTHHIVLSHSQDTKKNPLSGRQKLLHARRAFPHTNFTISDKESPNFLAQAKKLHDAGVTHLHMVGGSDRVKEFQDTLNRYNGSGEGKLFNFKKITVHSAGDRDPDAEGVTGISASKMREHASNNNFKEFRKGAPTTMSDAHARHMFNDVRKGMQVRESLDNLFVEVLNEGVHDKGIFKAVFLAGGPGSGKDYVLDRTLQGQGLTEINSDKALEYLMDKENLDKRMPENEKKQRTAVRERAKDLTDLRQRLALHGRNGIIVNGTGDDVTKISNIKGRLESLGYETYMILVNTANEISQQRNVERGQRGGRSVPEDVRQQKWNSVQKSRPLLADMFRNNYVEFDNSADLRNADPQTSSAKEKELLGIYKEVQKFVTTPPKNEIAKEWIASEMESKDEAPLMQPGSVQPHEDSSAAEQAKEMGLDYYGFGRYGKGNKVLYRSVHDRLVAVQKMNEEFEEFFAEDLRKWFDPKHPEGGWKRINSKGEAIGPCAREPGEPKPKCMSNEKRASLSKKERASAVAAKRKHDPNPERKGEPINVSNYGKGKLTESYDLSDSGAMNLLLLGTNIQEYDLSVEEEKKKDKYLSDKNGKVRTFMLRRAAAEEAHTKNGIVIPYKNGYIVKLNEETENVNISEGVVWNRIDEEKGTTRANTAYGFIRKHQYNGEETNNEQGRSEGKSTITLSEIRQRQKETNVQKIDEIDRGIEPGLSMATSGENATRPAPKNKLIKKPFEEAIGAGGEMATSMSDYNENDLKRKGIDLKTFKSKRPIG